MKKFFLPSLLLLTSIISFFLFDGVSVLTPEQKKETRLSGALQSLDFWTRQRAYPNEDIPQDAYYKAYETYKNTIAKNSFFLSQWEEMGPHNIGGRTIAVEINPINPNTIYAGSASGGLWRSYSGGVGVKAWNYVPTGFPVLSVGTVVINPADTNVMYIGTGEVYNYQKSIGGLSVRNTRGSYGIGILKTTNNGISWTKSLDWSYNQRRGVQVIRMHPTNRAILYAGTSEGVYKTTNAGVSWAQVHTALMTTDILINKQNPEILIAVCGNLFSANKGFYKSTNGGNNWTQITANIPNYGGKVLLADFNANPNIAWASVGMGDADGAGTFLLKSTDFGSTWVTVSTQDYSTYQGWYSHFVIPHPSDPEAVLTGGIDMWKSTNGGTSLTRKSSWNAWYFGVVPIGGPEGPPNYSHADHHAYAIHPLNPNTVYLANDGGIFRSTDFGETFVGCNGSYQSTQFYKRFGVSKADSTRGIGGMQDNSTAVWEGTLAWRRVLGGDGCCAQINPRNTDTMYGSSQYLNISRSINKGVNFSGLGLSSTNPAFNGQFLLAPSNPRILYAAGSRVYKSTVGGGSWATMNGSAVLNGDPVLSIAVSYTNPDTVYMTTAPALAPAAVFRSTNGGVNFTNITGTLPDRYPVDISVDPKNSSIVYVVMSGFGTSHLFRSTNGGTSWNDIGTGLPDVPTSAIAIDPFNPSLLYVGNDLGLFYSVDNGNSWSDANSGIEGAVLVMDLQISPVDKKMVVATHGRGVYRIPLLSIVPVELISFEGKASGSSVQLLWTTSTELNNYGFEIERKKSNDAWRTIGFVKGNGTTQEKSDYSYIDKTSGSSVDGKILYRLKQIDFNGKSRYSSEIEVENLSPDQYILFQNFPNPFNSSTTIKFTLPVESEVSLKLFDITGKLVKTLFQGKAPSGTSEYIMDKKDFDKLSSGVYLYTLNSSSFSKTMKLVVLK